MVTKAEVAIHAAIWAFAAVERFGESLVAWRVADCGRCGRLGRILLLRRYRRAGVYWGKRCWLGFWLWDLVRRRGEEGVRSGANPVGEGYLCGVRGGFEGLVVIVVESQSDLLHGISPCDIRYLETEGKISGKDIFSRVRYQ